MQTQTKEHRATFGAHARDVLLSDSTILLTYV